jgi:hypothetical protein
LALPELVLDPAAPLLSPAELLVELLGLLVELLEPPLELHAASSMVAQATAIAMTSTDTRLVKREVLLIQISFDSSQTDRGVDAADTVA